MSDCGTSVLTLAVPGKLWTHREFAFTIENDVYIRYNSFNTAYDFQKEVLRLTPSRFEIGPQYTHRVSCHVIEGTHTSPETARRCLLAPCSLNAASSSSIST